jgi:hypothetical protein
MVNTSRRSAFGAALFVQSPEPILGFGFRPRYRRWLSPKVSVDLAPGIEYRSSNARFLPTGQLALNLGSGFALTGNVHVIPAIPEAERKAHFAWYVGARLGGGLGLAGVLGMVALTALVAATWN